jgi:hypothetical protein
MLGFIAFITTMLGFVAMMASFSMPHNINSIDEVLPTSVGYDSNYSVGNV